MDKFLIGTDIGTSGTKSVIINLNGEVLAESLSEYSVITPNPVWAEQWPDVWVNAVFDTVHDVVKRSKVDPQNIKGICISGLYGGSGIPLDENLNPVRPCIIWMDRRAEKECEYINEKIGVDRLFSITGNGIDPYFGYSKILWIKNNEPDSWEKIKLFLPPHSYAIYKITNEVSMDHTSAGNLGGIYDLRNNCWSKELMEEMGIPGYMMPSNLKSPDEIVGSVTADASVRLGLPEGTPVCAGSVDCLASTLAVGAVNSGQHVAVIGTSINWGVIHSNFPSNQAFITMPYVIKSKEMYYTYGGASTAGALPKWFKDNFAKVIRNTNGLIEDSTYNQLNDGAEKVKPGSDGLIVLPYFMGERSPIWDPNARGVIFGLTLHHSKEHVYRAILESVAYSLRHIIETSKFDITEDSRCFLTGGVTNSKLWIQIFADVTGLPVVYSKDYIQAPVADALIAGIATGIFMDYSEINNWITLQETIYPDTKNHAIYSKYFVEYKKLYLSLKENMRSIAELTVEKSDK